MKEENPNMDFHYRRISEDYIEELLNSFIDGELTERHRVEVQRMISRDARIAQRLRELQKCKMLVGSLPRGEAPAQMLEQIKASLERPTVPDRQPERFVEREGARHLLFRRVLTAAAMIGLVAVLGAVIYTIVVPESGTRTPVDGGVVDVPRLGPSIVAKEFYGRLELKTSKLVAVDASINRAIEDNGLSDCTSARSEAGKSVYAISCSREALDLLLADLEYVWARFDSATLLVGTDQFAEQIVVDAVTAEQVGRIVNQDSFEKRIGIAKDIAVLNNMAELMPAEEIFAVIDGARPELVTIPKPVLTSKVKTTKRLTVEAEDKEKVHLTIVLEGSK